VRNFTIELIVALILLYLAWKKWPVPQIKVAMANQQEKIRSSLDAADKARSEALAADDERHAALEETRQTAQEIVAQANRTAEAVRVNAQARGEAEFERISEIVMDLVEQVIGREVDAEAHGALIDEAVRALQADTSGGAAAGAAISQ
jgi:F0F1-type ATP synthase membrane subunit b/b'